MTSKITSTSKYASHKHPFRMSHARRNTFKLADSLGVSFSKAHGLMTAAEDHPIHRERKIGLTEVARQLHTKKLLPAKAHVKALATKVAATSKPSSSGKVTHMATAGKYGKLGMAIKLSKPVQLNKNTNSAGNIKTRRSVIKASGFKRVPKLAVKHARGVVNKDMKTHLWEHNIGGGTGQHSIKQALSKTKLGKLFIKRTPTRLKGVK